MICLNELWWNGYFADGFVICVWVDEDVLLPGIRNCNFQDTQGHVIVHFVHKPVEHGIFHGFYAGE